MYWANSRIIEEESNVKNKENDTDGALSFVQLHLVFLTLSVLVPLFSNASLNCIVELRKFCQFVCVAGFKVIFCARVLFFESMRCVAGFRHLKCSRPRETSDDADEPGLGN